MITFLYYAYAVINHHFVTNFIKHVYFKNISVLFISKF